MKSLFVTPECAPFAADGGVAIVARDLPAALVELGIEVTIVIPRHGGILPKFVGPIAEFEYTVSWGGRQEHVRVYRGTAPHTNVLFVENVTHFSGHKVYNSDVIPFESDVRRYSFFAKACLELVRQLKPDIVHVNDWTGGYLLGWMELENRKAAAAGLPLPFPQRRVLTIHNFCYQGQTWKGRIDQTGFQDLCQHQDIGALFGDPRPAFDCVNPMRLALELADAVNAVSPNYAVEITRPENADAYFSGGQGLESITQRLRDTGRLTGILNGMNYTTAARSPEAQQEFENLLIRKREEKVALSRYFANPQGVLLGFVGRAVEQKMKLLTDQLQGRSVLEHILDLPNVNVLVVASGEAEYERFLTSLAIERFQDGRSYDDLRLVSRRRNFAAFIGHDPQMGRRVQLGSEVFLMPSAFEPCGISQLESMSAATPPLVRSTGGLDDTVIPHWEPNGTGFKFDGTSRDEVLQALVNIVREATQLVRHSPDAFRTLQWNAYQARFPWSDSALQYRDQLYIGG